MAGTVSKVTIGPVWVVYNSVDLGYTKGGTTITRQFITKEIVIQNIPTDVVCIRKEVLVNVLMAETNYSKLQNMLNLNVNVGDNLLDNTHTLTLTAVNDPSDVTTVPDAFPVGNTEVPFMLDKERVWPVQFRAIYTTSDFYFAEIS